MPRDVIGTAYVRIIAMSEDFEKQVQQSFNKLRPMAEKSGQDSSQAFADGWDKGLKNRLQEGHRKALEDMHVQSAQAGTDGGQLHGRNHADASREEMVKGHQSTLATLTTDSADGGTIGGDQYGRNWRDQVVTTMGKSINDSQNLWRNSNLMRYSLEDLQQLAKDMPDILGGGADNSGRSMRQRLSGHFSNIGADLKNTFDNVGKGISATLGDIFKGGAGGGRMWKYFTDGADEASRAFTMFFSIAEVGGSLLVGLVAGIANVVSGLFALVSAAGQAGPALAVIPGLIAAIAQAGITMMVGFKGVGKAITEGMKVTGDSMGGAATRAKELETAQRAVANASRAVQSAEESAARAKNNLKKAQEDLNDAYKEGAKQLRDIQYAAEDAALQEERSAINLANARDELAKVKATNPADSRAVQEAELAYKEADLSYREARSRNKDASAEAADATKKGVKGTQAVTSAQDRLVAAQQAVTDSNQRVTDAVIALADAQKTLVATQNGSLGSMKTYNDALKKFGPEGQRFIKTVIAMQGQFRGLKQAAGEGMFKALNVELGQFANGPFFPMLKRNFALTSTAMGGVITQFSNMLQSADNMKSLDRVMQSNTVVIGSMGRGATALGQIFLTITDAARGITQQFAKWTAATLDGWAATLKAQNASGELSKKFTKAADIAKQLGRIFKNVAGAFHSTGVAASNGGRMILDATEAASKKWNDWTKSIGGQNQLKTYFDNVAKGWVPLMEGINAVVKALLKLGGNVETVTALGDSLKIFAKVIGPVGNAVEKIAPMFSDFAKQLGIIFSVMQESGALEYFMKVLTGVAKGIANVLTWLMNFQAFDPGSLLGKIFNGKNIIFFVGAVMGVVRALRLLNMGFSFLGKATIGKALLTLTHGFKGLKNILGGKSFFHGMVRSSEDARKEFEKQIAVDKLKKRAAEGIKEGAEGAEGGIKKMTLASKLSRAVKDVGGKVKTGVAKFTGTYKSPMVALDQYGKQPKQTVGGLVAAANDRRAAAALAAQKRPTIRSRIGGLVQSRVALATGNEGGFIGRTTKDTSAGVGRTGGAFSAAVGRFTGGLGKVGSALGGAVSKFSGGVGKVGGVFSGAMGRFSSGLSKVGGSFGGVVGKFTSGMGKIGSTFSSAVGKFSGGVGKVSGKIGGAVGKVGGGLQGAGSRIRATAGGIGSRVASGASRVASGASGLATAGKRSLMGGVAVAGLAISAVTAISKMNKDSAKALGDQVGSIMKSLPEGLKQLSGQLPRMLSSIGSAIGPVIQSISEALPNILAGIGAAIPKVIAGITTAFPRVVGAITALLPTLITTLVKLLPIVINAVVKLLPLLINAIAKFLPVVITTIVKLIPLVITAFVKLIPIIINAIVKLLPVVIKVLATALPAIIKGIAFALPLIIGAFASAIPEIIKAIADALPLIVTGISEAIPQILQAFQAAFPQIVQAVATALPLIWQALQEMWPVIQKIFTDNVPKILSGLGTMISAILSWIGKNGPVILGKLLEWGKAFIGWIGPRIPGMLAALAGFIAKIVVWIAQQIPVLLGKLAEWAGAFIGWLVPKIPGMLLALGEFVGKILVWIVQQIPTIIKKLVEWAGAFISWIAPLLIKLPIELAKLWLKIAGWVAGIAIQIPGKVAEWIGAFLGWIGGLIKQVPGKLGEIWTKIAGWISEIPGKIGRAAVGIWDNLWSGLKTSFVGAINGVISLWNNFKIPSFTIGGWDLPWWMGGGKAPKWDTPEINFPDITPIKMALGGIIDAKAGGTTVLLGEGGRSEVVKPLDAKGLTASDRLIVDMMKAQSVQMAKLIASFTSPLGDTARVAPLVTSTATRAAVIATQQTMSTQGGVGTATTAQVATAIDHLTASVDALQKPLVGGDLNVVSAPNEWAAESVPRALRRRAYVRGRGAR